jgi:hypothetical protein
MENANCTFYANGKAIRGKLGNLTECGHSVMIPANDYIECTGDKIPSDKKFVIIPGIRSDLIKPDDSVTIIKEVVSDMDMTIDSIRTIEHEVSNWQWHE